MIFTKNIKFFYLVKKVPKLLDKERILAISKSDMLDNELIEEIKKQFLMK